MKRETERAACPHPDRCATRPLPRRAGEVNRRRWGSVPGQGARFEESGQDPMKRETERAACPYPDRCATRPLPRRAGEVNKRRRGAVPGHGARFEESGQDPMKRETARPRCGRSRGWAAATDARQGGHFDKSRNDLMQRDRRLPGPERCANPSGLGSLRGPRPQGEGERRWGATLTRVATLQTSPASGRGECYGASAAIGTWRGASCGMRSARCATMPCHTCSTLRIVGSATRQWPRSSSR
jgi:hypothetical protein